ncbi:MAG: hypothetical protein JWP91_2695 [Fibrobacteres bacterium]|nr:hypothetical protein [Fibrobacterota bacterium]
MKAGASADSTASTEASAATAPFSIYWEIRTLLYLGIVAVSTGLGILIYKNIDTLGHQTILAVIGLGSAGCLGYCARRAAPFTAGKGGEESSWADYMLLLGVLLFGVFTGYLQFKYSVFGTHYGLALAIPASFYLFLAYRFDHRGVLQLAISGFCGSVGVATTPLAAFHENMFNRHAPILSALAVGAALALAGILSGRLDFKRHFSFAYLNFALHLCMIAAYTGLVLGGAWEKWLWFFLLAAMAAGLWRHAKRARSPYFLLCSVLYGYLAVTYVILHLVFRHASTASMYAALAYFILSCGGTIHLFLNLKNLLGTEDAGLPEN